MEILGASYSGRIDKLCEQLEQLAGAAPVFDPDIEPDEVFGTPRGTYHSESMPPRISLPHDAPEETVAHELIHGILCQLDYPGWSVAFRERFPYATDTAHEIAHCCIHIAVDRRMQAIGYNVEGVKAASAEEKREAIADKRREARDLSAEHWWSIRIACDLAYFAAPPAVAHETRQRFEAEGLRHFPGCGPLAESFKAAISSIDTEDPQSVQEVMSLMLRGVESRFGAYKHCENLSKVVILTPFYVTSARLVSPAEQSVRTVKARTPGGNGRSAGKLAFIVDKDTGRSIGSSVVLSRAAFSKEWKVIQTLLRRPLKDFLEHCQVRYAVRAKHLEPGD